MASYRRLKLAGAGGRSRPDAEAVFVLEGTRQVPQAARPVDQRSGGAVAATLKRSDFDGELASVERLPAAEGATVFVVGLGPAERLEGNQLRTAAGKLVKAARAAGVRRLAIEPSVAIGEVLSAEAVGLAVGDGLVLGNMAFNAFKGAASGTDPQKAMDLTVEGPRDIRDGLSRALAQGEGVNSARTLSATPPNVAHPDYVADYCRRLAPRTGLQCRVIEPQRAERLGMGGLLAVGKAGSRPPKLIELEWPGRGTNRGRKKQRARKKTSGGSRERPVMLVGKAITFDTGGYSLKPSSGMQGMKYDKCGGMAVIGAMEAIAALNVKRRVVGLVPCAENMIDQQAYRIDDILTLANGVTVEVTNTDAEGRLVLADALAYGVEHYRPRAAVDLGTLTGGIVVALGKSAGGLFCPDDDLRERILSASGTTGEKVWPMPLWHEHRDQMTSAHADIVNTADRKAQPIQCAAFLSHFVGNEAAKRLPRVPWAHIDIAGMAAAEESGALYAKGPTGFGVRLMTELVRGM
jgi:leucyl aminopeptidase